MIRARRDQLLRVHFRNGLPNDTQTNFLGHSTRQTNLHTHGLHVSPGDNPNGTHSDNMMTMLMPGAGTQYEYDLSKHPGGNLNFYHPHIHNSATDQMSRGMSAPLVVEDEVTTLALFAQGEPHVRLVQVAVAALRPWWHERPATGHPDDTDIRWGTAESGNPDSGGPLSTPRNDGSVDDVRAQADDPDPDHGHGHGHGRSRHRLHHLYRPRTLLLDTLNDGHLGDLGSHQHERYGPPVPPSHELRTVPVHQRRRRPLREPVHNRPGMERRNHRAPGGQGELLMPVRDYPGMAMLHCHLIEHEDIGMMGTWHITDGGGGMQFASPSPLATGVRASPIRAPAWRGCRVPDLTQVLARTDGQEHG